MQKILLAVAIVAVLVFYPTGALGKSDKDGKGNDQSQEHGKGHENVLFGSLESVTDNQILIKGKHEEGTVSAELDKDTEIEQGGHGHQPRSILRKNGLVALISTESGELASRSGHPKKFVKIFFEDASASAQEKRHAVQGVITSINGSTLTLSHQIHRDQQWTISVTPATIIKMKNVASPTLASLQVGMRIVAIGDNSGTGLTAIRIHVIPGKANGIFKKQPVSSSSASPVASSSATPSASGSATPAPTQTPEASASATPAATP